MEADADGLHLLLRVKCVAGQQLAGPEREESIPSLERTPRAAQLMFGAQEAGVVGCDSDGT